MALMGRVLRRDDPLEVWGDGHQVRNWTFVEDVVLGLSLAGALPTGAHTVNLGSPEGHTVRDALELLFKAAGHEPRLRFLPEMPTGPLSRVASCALAEQLLGWRPRVPLDEGLTRTLRWYQRSVRLHRLKAAGTHLHTPR
jgi:nucleoside-diphosphate-sugar epimerase